VKRGDNLPGATYVAHLDPPYKHARHYVGFAEGGQSELEHRLAQHGTAEGAGLLAVQKAAGGIWHVSRTWPGTTRAFERHLKDTRSVLHYCPDCQPQINADWRTSYHARRTVRPNDRPSA
jgi:hypothetical protein